MRNLKNNEREDTKYLNKCFSLLYLILFLKNNSIIFFFIIFNF